MIEVKPAIDLGAVAPTAAQKADAKAKAEAALKDLQGGKAWDDVAKTVSTDTSTAPQAGDLGWLTADDSQSDEAFLKAVFATAANTPTAVIEGADGIFRIGRVDGDRRRGRRRRLPGQDPERQDRPAALPGRPRRRRPPREAARPRSSRTSPAAGPQRHVSEIYVARQPRPSGADAIKVRHILYSPKDDPTNASRASRPTIPSWEVAAPAGASPT